MRKRIIELIKAHYLVNEDAMKNWRFLLFIVVLAMLMVANSHRYEKKSFEIVSLNKEVKELRATFVDRRSELMKLKMESTVASKMESRGIVPSNTPPTKIELKEFNSKPWFKRIWQ